MAIHVSFKIGGYLKRSSLVKVIELIPKDNSEGAKSEQNDSAIETIQKFIDTGEQKKHEKTLDVRFYTSDDYDLYEFEKIFCEEKINALIEGSRIDDCDYDCDRPVVTWKDRYKDGKATLFTSIDRNLVMSEDELRKVCEDMTMEEFKKYIDRCYLPVSPIVIHESARESLAWKKDKLTQPKK